MEKDMTKGSPLPVILQFTLPLIIGNIFQQLYNMADTIIVGRYVGADALAAVGSSTSLICLLIAFKRHSTGSPFHSCPDILQHDLHAAIAASHEHTGKYFSGRLYLYYDYLRWPDRYDFLQSAFLLSACSRKPPDSADVPAFFGCIKCMQPFSPREFLLCSVFFIFIAPCRICGRKNTTGSFMRQIPAISSRWAFRWHSSLPSPHPVQ